jgi:TP901 family phage tail tape measure protein
MRDLATSVVAKVEQSLQQFGKTTRGVADEVARASSAINSKLGKSLESVGSSMKSAGMGLTFGVTAPLGGAAVAAMKFASDYESNMKKVEVLSGVAADQVQKFSKAMLGLGKETATGPNELAKAMLVVTSTGIRGAEALDITKKAAQGAAMGMGEAKDVARAVTSIMTAYAGSNMTATDAMDKLFVAVREGGAEANELAGVIGRVVGVGAQLGVSFDEIGAYIATFTRLGVDAAEATTSIGAVMSSILDPTQDAGNALASIGLSASELQQSIKDKGLAQTLMDLQEAFKGDTTAMAAVFGNVRALRGVLGNTGAQAAAYTEIVEKSKNAHGEFGKGVAEMSKTTQFQWKAMRAAMESASVQIGTALLPFLNQVIGVVQALVPYVEKAAQAFTALPEPIQKIGVALGVIAIAAGPVTFALGSMLGVFGKLLGSEALGGLLGLAPRATAALVDLYKTTAAFGAEGFTAVLRQWGDKLSPLTTKLATAGSAIKSFGATVAETGRSIASFKVSTITDGLGKVMTAVRGLSFASVANGLSGLMTWVVQLATKIPLLGAAFTFLTGPVGLTIAALAALALGIRYLTGSWDFLTKPLKYVADLMADLYIIAKDKLGSTLKWLGGEVVGWLAARWADLSAAASAVATWFKNLWKGASDLGTALGGPLVAAFSAVGSWLLQTFPWLQTLVDWFGKVKAAVADAYDWLANKFGWAIEKVGGFIAGATGMWTEWRAGIKKSADALREKNKVLDSTAIATGAVVAPMAQMATGMKDAAAGASALNSGAKPLTEQLAATKKLLAGLTDEQRKNIMAGLEMGRNASDIAAQMNVLYPKLHITEQAVEMFKKSLEGTSTASKAAKKDLEEFKRVVEDLGGVTATKAAFDLVDALAQIGDVTKLTQAQLQSAQGTFEAYFDAMTARSEKADATVKQVAADVAAALATANAAAIFDAPIKAAEQAVATLARIGDVSKLTQGQLESFAGVLDQALTSALAEEREVPAQWYEWRNAIAEATKKILDQQASLDGLAKRKEVVLAATKALAEQEKALATIQQQVADDRYLRTLPAKWREVARAAQEYRDRIKSVQSGQERVNELVKALGDKVAPEVVASLQGMVPAFEAIAEAERQAVASGFTGMIEDAGVAGAGMVAAIVAAVTAGAPAIGAALQAAAAAAAGGGAKKVGIGEALSKGGFFDYFKNDLTGDVIAAIQGGGDVGRTLATGVAGKALDAFGKIGKDALTGMGKAAAGAAAGVGAFFTGLDTGAKTGSKALGALAGAGQGAMQGFMYGGPIGAAIGGIAGLVGGLIGAGKAAKKARDEFIASAGGLEKVKEMAKYAGVSLDALMKAKSKGAVEKEIKKLEEAIKKVQERVQKLTTDLGTMAQTGAIANADMIKRIKADWDKPEIKQAFGEFFKANLDRATTGLTTFLTKSKDLPMTAQAATAIGAALGGVFATMREQGMTALEALTALKEPIAAFEERLKKAGLSGGEAFDQLRAYSALATDEFAGPLLEAVGGIGDALVGLQNTGLLNQEMFAGLASQVGAVYTQLEAQGKGGDAALQMMQPTLQRLWELQQAFGYETDAATQKLIDQAVESGIVGEKFKSAQDRMADALDKLLGRFDLFLEKLGVQVPKAAQQGAAGVTDAFGRIRVPNVKVPVEYEFPDMPTIRVDVEAGNVPEMAAGGVVKKATYALIGEKGPEAVIPLRDLKGLFGKLLGDVAAKIAKPPDWQAMAREFAAAKQPSPDVARLVIERPADRRWEGPPPADLVKAPADRLDKIVDGLEEVRKPAAPVAESGTVNITIQALDPVGLKKVVETEVAPLLVSAYRRNVNGVRTETRKELVE